MNHPDIVRPGDLDHPFEKIQIDALGRRIARKIHHQHLRSRPGLVDRLFQFLEKIVLRRHGHMTHIGAGNDETVGMDRIGGIGYQHRVARPHAGQRKVRQPLFRADGDDGLGVRIQDHVDTGPCTSCRSRAADAACRATSSSGAYRCAGPPRPVCRRCAWASAGRGCPCRNR